MIDSFQSTIGQHWFFPYVVSLFSFIVIYAIASVFFGSKKGKDWNRFNNIQRQELRKQFKKDLDADALRKNKDESIFSKIVEVLDLKKIMQDDNVKGYLVRAGISHSRALSMFYFFRLTVPFVLVVFLFMLFLFVSDFGMSQGRRIMAYMFAFVAGFYLPTLYVKNLADRRQEKIIHAFPDALDMLLVCVEAGISIEQALIKVASEIGDSSPDLAEELALTNAELSYIQDRKQAYHNLARRNPNQGIRSVATALIQSERYGTPVGAALRVMVKENRQMRVTAAERKAAALPTKLTVPMIGFFMPVVFIVILGPIAVQFLG